MATTEEIRADLADIVNEVAGVDADDVQLDKSFVDDLDVDSLSMVEVVVAAEEKFGVSIPDFWMGILLIGLFATTLGWLPTSGYRPLFDDPAGWLRHIILPGLTVGVVAAAIMTRYVRAAVLEVAAMGYVRTARSKGLDPQVVTFRHTVRNALVPILTITGIQLATILGGVIVVEVVFAWPGLGRLVFNSVASRDYPVIQGAVLLMAVLIMVGATAITMMGGAAAGALVPFAVGLLAATVTYGRWRAAPAYKRARQS